VQVLMKYPYSHSSALNIFWWLKRFRTFLSPLNQPNNCFSMATTPKKPQPPNPYRPNMWGMIQNVLINATNRGQIIAGFLGIIVLIGILKMPPADVSKLFFQTMATFKTFSMYGWIIACIILLTSYVMFNRVRKLHRSEVEGLINAIRDKAK
jgi:hypothetical protein